MRLLSLACSSLPGRHAASCPAAVTLDDVLRIVEQEPARRGIPARGRHGARRARAGGRVSQPDAVASARRVQRRRAHRSSTPTRSSRRWSSCRCRSSASAARACRPPTCRSGARESQLTLTADRDAPARRPRLCAPRRRAASSSPRGATRAEPTSSASAAWSPAGRKAASRAATTSRARMPSSRSRTLGVQRALTRSGRAIGRARRRWWTRRAGGRSRQINLERCARSSASEDPTLVANPALRRGAKRDARRPQARIELARRERYPVPAGSSAAPGRRALRRGELHRPDERDPDPRHAPRAAGSSARARSTARCASASARSSASLRAELDRQREALPCASRRWSASSARCRAPGRLPGDGGERLSARPRRRSSSCWTRAARSSRRRSRASSSSPPSSRPSSSCAPCRQL